MSYYIAIIFRNKVLHSLNYDRVFNELTKSQNVALQTCYAFLLTHGNLLNRVVEYNLYVALCCSGAIFAAVCNDFRQEVFSHL